ncbi:MAG: hypothetical protein JRJ24_09790 [Deltaproteobacteria bacterium]|jgi:hypothetical protein|nr:hypothetical protein [Deltaproteobacteria bacterium]
MDAQARNNIMTTRVGHYYEIVRTANFLLLGTAAVIIWANTAGAELAIAVLVVGAGLYGILAGDRALSDVTALRSDMDKEDRDTNWGRSLQAAPLPVFRGISGLIYAAIVATQLMLLFGAQGT